MNMDIPKDKSYPTDSVQCDSCGGFGCATCDDKGWLTPKDHPDGRRCLYKPCNKPFDPAQIAVYCSNECARNDA
ncbi:MAG: hypothetical protein UT80_C0011G0002 [Parcubacteria group bacterium GW2011_GWC1_40_13]|nr:MAG: hypothetical protein UT80_C0011G0002 [Parcubacteria group bacterium GW2011_GWC1_40_13]